MSLEAKGYITDIAGVGSDTSITGVSLTPKCAVIATGVLISIGSVDNRGESLTNDLTVNTVMVLENEGGSNGNGSIETHELEFSSLSGIFEHTDQSLHVEGRDG